MISSKFTGLHVFVIHYLCKAAPPYLSNLMNDSFFGSPNFFTMIKGECFLMWRKKLVVQYWERGGKKAFNGIRGQDCWISKVKCSTVLCLMHDLSLSIMWLIQSESEYSQSLDFMAIEYLEVIFPEENKVFLSLSSGLSLAQPGEQFGHNCVAYTTITYTKHIWLHRWAWPPVK